MLTKPVYLEIDKPNYVPIYTVQYDYNSRFYEITILNNSQPLDLTGIRVIVAGKKPDGKEVFNSCKVLDAKKGLIQLELTEQMNAVNGASEYALELFSADGMLSSQPFKLIVTRSTISKSVESSKELGALKDALNEVQDIDNRFAQTNAQLSDLKSQVENGETGLSDVVGTIRVSNSYSTGQIPNGGYLSIIDDDNAVQVWDILKPISEELRIPFCVAVPSTDIKSATGGSMTQSQLKYLQDNLGWEICGHTVSHCNLGTLDYKQQLYELRNNKELLASWGLDVRGLCYPFGSFNNDTLDIMSQYYDYGFNGGQGAKYNTVDKFENYMIYRIAIGSYEPSGSNGDLQYYKDKIDEVIANNGWLVLMTHVKDGDHTEDDTRKLKQVIEYAQSKNMTISTPNKIFEKYKNIVEIKNKLKIKVTGEIDEIANTSKINVIQDNTKTAINLLTDFKPNAITYTCAFKRDAGNENLPDNGTLETINYLPLKGSGGDVKDFNFRHQKLYGLQGGIWYRQPVKYNDWNWGEWKVLLSTTQQIITEAVTMNSQTIPANSSLRIPFDLINKSKIGKNSVVCVSPNGGIEDDVTYNVDMWGTNGFAIRLYNISGSSKSTAQRGWTIKIIN